MNEEAEKQKQLQTENVYVKSATCYEHCDIFVFCLNHLLVCY